jgi:hypothetical protein
MSSDRKLHRNCRALGAALALAATAALANDPAAQASAAQGALHVAAADGTLPMAAPSGWTPAHGYPSSEIGVRRAAAQGPEELRRYIWRTRMIHNYAFASFYVPQ